MQARTRRSGFTLIELVVVVLILGIIAAIAAPKMFNVAGDARLNSTKQSLQVVRDAIELYYSQNNAYPPATDDATFKTALKPYIRGKFPSSPIGNTNGTVRMGTTDPLTASGTEGWAYNGTTGEFVCNHASGIAF
jgi:general secretion pathway protein G